MKVGAIVRKQALLGVCVVAAVLTGRIPDVRADTLIGSSIPLQVGSLYASPLNLQLRYTASGDSGPMWHTFSGVGAGNIHPDTISQTSLPYMYCVDIIHDIFVPGQYLALVDNTGYIVNDVPPSSGAMTTVVDGQTVLANAGNIAWLMTNYAASATTIDQQLALQAAIWHEVYGTNFQLAVNPVSNSAGTPTSDDNTVNSLYASYISLAYTHTAPVGSVLWINPNQRWDGSQWVSGAYQAQVGLVNPVPGTLTMSSIFLGMIGIVQAGRALKKKQSAVAA
jgi:hypothetical protein